MFHILSFIMYCNQRMFHILTIFNYLNYLSNNLATHIAVSTLCFDAMQRGQEEGGGGGQATGLLR